MYGYNDYNGPSRRRRKEENDGKGNNVKGSRFSTTTTNPNSCHDQNNYIDGGDDDDDPLRVGKWMEGDSLAPPCGSSLPLVHAMLSFASISKKDVLYDLGCGDGRVCLEAHVEYGCRECVGVEIEEELVDRFHELIGRLHDTEEEQYERCKVEQAEKEENDSIEEEECSILRQSNIRAIHGDLVEVLQALLDVDTKKYDSNIAGVKSEQPFGMLPIPTVICLYLLPEALELINPFLVKLMQRHEPNLRVVCNTWGLKGLKPVKTLDASTGDGDTITTSTTLTMYTHESVS